MGRGYRNTPYHVNFTGGFSGHNNPGAQTWYVGAATALDGVSPSDSNSGRSPQQAFSTIQKGLDSCTAGRGDYVVLLPGSYTITAVLTMTIADVTLVAAQPPAPYCRSGVVIVCATDSISMLDIDADNCTVEGITFDHNTTTANVILIDVADTTSSVGLTLRNLFIDMEGSATNTDAIRLGDGTQTVLNSLIEYCTIHDPDQIGIAIGAGSDENVVRCCLFRDSVTANASTYHVQCGGDNCLIEDNISNSAGTANLATAAAAATENIFSRNRLWARGANTIGIQARVAADTLATMDNMIMAAAAGNLIDFTTTSTSPGGDSGSMGNTTATNPTISVLVTPTVDGS